MATGHPHPLAVPDEFSANLSYKLSGSVTEYHYQPHDGGIDWCRESPIGY